MTRYLVLASVIVSSLLGACGGGTDPRPRVIVDVYSLETVAGDPLPYVVDTQWTGGRLELRADRLSLYDDGSFIEVSDLYDTRDGGRVEVSDTVGGRHVTRGSTIEFTYVGRTGARLTIEGAVTGGTLQVAWDNGVYVYRKEP